MYHRVYFANLWNRMSPKGQKTFQWDLVRGVCDGTGNTLHTTFALLVAIEFFRLPDGYKALIASGTSVGMGISFLYATYAHCLIGRRNVEAAIPVFLSSVCFVAASLAQDGITFAFLAFIGHVLFMIRFPLMTQIYRENYRRENRGQAFGFSVLVASVGSILMVRLGGLYLDGGMERYRTLYQIIAALVFCGSFAILRIPSDKTPRQSFPNPFNYFSILAKDRAFCYILFVWSVFGFANLMMIPQRLEYVTQDRYGLSLNPGMVALIVGAIPELVKILLVIPMGWLFDRMNFIVLRIVINIFFGLYMLVYFHATSIPMLAFGSVLLGVSFAGGTISWNLWVTKFAIPSETAKYMAMHTFFNGIRGVLAPVAGYIIASTDSIQTASDYSVGLMFVSCLMLAPLIPKGAPFDRQNRLEEG
ncbi:MAG: MFS transporter [Candidatus Omnitrophica bacterium]|nr:MFS transporter [Candidatus Omnitrophota bacterium]MCB9769824.1 MFS transporter [Candidatus Omnitrophota bacterium]MCB9783871.1 MFS transporter [Candidatus Omnitrophota bacterium]